MTNTLRLFCISMLTSALVSCGSGGDKQGASTDAGGQAAAATGATMYYGGDILTMEGDSATYAEAIVVKDGRILFVGGKDEAMKQAGEGHQMVDLQGKTLAPGFVDGHAHFLAFGPQAVGANLLASPDGQANTIDELVAKLKEFAAGPDVGRTGWIFGLGYDDALLGRHPNRDDLDKVSTEIPVIAVHISGHFSALNTAALKKVGITADSKDPEGGVIRRRPGSKEPLGVQEENAHFSYMLPAINPTKDEDKDYLPRKVLSWPRVLAIQPSTKDVHLISR